MPILIPFLLYTKPMLDCESLKVSAMVTNKLDPDHPYLAEDDVVLVDPPVSVTVSILKQKDSFFGKKSNRFEKVLKWTRKFSSSGF